MLWMAVLLIALYTGAIDKLLSPTIGYLVSVVPEYNSTRSKEPPKGWPTNLQPPIHAEEVDYRVHSDPNDAPLFYGLVFELDISYPANGIWEEFENHLTPLGWRRLQYQLADPNLSAPKAWITEPTEGSAYLFLWEQNWVGSESGVLKTQLLYHSRSQRPRSSEAMQCIWVWYPEGQWPDAFLEEYQKMHPEEFEGLSSPE
jgi:hypothetical protein